MMKAELMRQEGGGGGRGKRKRKRWKKRRKSKNYLRIFHILSHINTINYHQITITNDSPFYR